MESRRQQPKMEAALGLKIFQICGINPKKRGGDAKADVDGPDLAMWHDLVVQLNVAKWGPSGVYTIYIHMVGKLKSTPTKVETISKPK